MAFKGTRAAQRRATSPRRSRRSAAISTPTPRASRPPTTPSVLKEDVALGARHPRRHPAATRSSIADELDRERSVILQEIGQVEDTPDDIIFDLFQETAFPDQPIGRPVLGTRRRSSSLPREAIGDYHARALRGAATWWSPRPGSVEHERCRRAGRAAFGALPPTGAARASRPLRGGETVEDAISSRCTWCSASRASLSRSPTTTRLGALRPLLGGGMSSRLFQEVREKRGLVYSIYTFAASYVDRRPVRHLRRHRRERDRRADAGAGDELVKSGTPPPEDEVAAHARR